MPSTIYVKVEPDLHDRVAEVAAEDDRSISSLVRVALREYIDRRDTQSAFREYIARRDTPTGPQ